MELEQEKGSVNVVDSPDEMERLREDVYSRLMARFDAMGAEAKAMLRLYSTMLAIDGIAGSTAVGRVIQDFAWPTVANDPAYNDSWIAGFVDCLEVMSSRL
ncbi:MAG: hypothetical protein IH624_04980 [Phycisphaerae bacterium]|nr:hypothetical protein [Phycisphaerae bacterium]